MDIEGEYEEKREMPKLSDLVPDYTYLNKVYFSVDKEQYQELQNTIKMCDEAKNFRKKVKRKRRFKIDMFNFRLQFEIVNKNYVI